MKKIMLGCALLLPGQVVASGPDGLFYILGLQILLFALPLALPLFFLTRQNLNFKAYFFLLLITYGAFGVISIPFSLFTHISLGFGEFNRMSLVIDAQQLLGFLLALYVLKKYCRYLSTPTTYRPDPNN